MSSAFLFFTMVQQPQWARPSCYQGCMITVSYTRHKREDFLGWAISPTQGPLSDNTQHSQETDIHALGRIRTQNSSKRAAADPRLRPRGHWDRPAAFLFLNQRLKSCLHGVGGAVEGRHSVHHHVQTGSPPHILLTSQAWRVSIIYENILTWLSEIWSEVIRPCVAWYSTKLRALSFFVFSSWSWFGGRAVEQILFFLILTIHTANTVSNSHHINL